MLLGLNSVFVSLGILLTSLVGQFFDWRTMAAIFSGTTVISFVSMLCIPESPYWLIAFKPNRKNDNEVDVALRWIYKSTKVIVSFLFHCVIMISILFAFYSGVNSSWRLFKTT